MGTEEIIIQAISIVAMLMIIFSFQQKSQKLIILFQFFGALLFAIHFGLLGSMMGCLLNVINVVRAVIFSNKERLHTDAMPWTVGLLTVYVGAYVLTFTVLGTAPTPRNFVIEALPLISSVFMTLAFRAKSAKMTRILGFGNSPGWLIYNIFNFSIGGILCEIFAMVSVVVGVIRHDLRKKDANKDKAAISNDGKA